MAKHSTRTSEAEVRTLPEAASLRTDQRERRQRIIDAAERMMFDVDYEKIQVKDVADEAEVALGTLYRYFNSKDHLFACALQSWSQRFGDHLELVADRPDRGPGQGHLPAGGPGLRAPAPGLRRDDADPEQQRRPRGAGLA